MTINNGQVSLPPGTAESQTALSAAGEKGKAMYDLFKRIDPNGAEYVSGTRAGIADQFNNPPKLQVGQEPTAFRAQLEKIKDPIERTVMLNAFDNQFGGAPSVAASASSPQGIQVSPTSAQVASAAGQKSYATTRGTDIAKYVNQIQEAGASAGEHIDIAKQIQKLYGQFEGGTLSGFGMKVASAANSINIPIDPKLGDKENAIALANGMALEMKNKGGKNTMPGNFSDADRNFMVSQAPALTQTAKGRKQIVDGYVAMKEREQQIQQWMNNYIDANGQVDEKFFSQLRAYTSTHHIFK
jgi:hypothetical protein